MMPISSQGYRTQDYRTDRVRQDRLYVPLERSQPMFGITRGDIAAAIGVVLLGILAFPVAEILSAIVAGP